MYKKNFFTKPLCATNFNLTGCNLVLAAFYHEHNVERAIEYMTRAIEEKNDIPVWYSELAQYYDASNKNFRECLAIFRKNIDVVKEDVAVPKSLVQFYNLDGDYDDAIDLLQTHHSRTLEGGRGIHWHYVDAHTLKALQLNRACSITRPSHYF